MCHSFGFLSYLNPVINLVLIHSPSTWDHQIPLSIHRCDTVMVLNIMFLPKSLSHLVGVL